MSRPTRFSRRAFLAATGAAIAMPAATPKRPKLGLDLFSLRSQGWSPFELLDFAARNGAEVVNFSEPRFLANLDQAHLRKVKEHAVKLGLAVETGFGSICSSSSRFRAQDGTPREQLLRMIGAARIMGSPIVRCYLGSSQDRSGSVPLDEHIENTVKACKSVRSEALDTGIKIALENHAGDLQALQLKTLIEEAGRDYVGALIDAGNATWTLEDPFHTLEMLAPYAVTSGIRDSAVWETEEGANVMWVPLGEGNVDIGRWIARLAELRPDVPVSLEVINVRSPRSFPYLKPEFWDAYRDVPAWVFSGFLQLAKKGQPYTGVPQPPLGVLPDSDAFRQFARNQERRDVERDLRFARQVLDRL